MIKRVRISSKGQITLPNELRKKHHFNEGETVLVLDSGDGIIIKHAKETLRGILKGKIDMEGFEKDIRNLREEWKL